MTDTIPALDVVGGLWEGAPARTLSPPTCTTPPQPHDWLVMGPPRRAAGTVWYPVGIHKTTTDASREVTYLRLTSLGIMGLSLRVCERMDWPRRLNTGRTCERLAETEWFREHGPTMAGLTRALTWASTYLARLDRLCAAVWPDYRVVPGAVPGWERTAGGWTAWQLRWDGRVAEPLGTKQPDTPDPLAALAAGLEAM